MRKGLLLACMAFISSSSFAQTEVTPYTPGATVEGVTYFLPKTALRFVVTAQKKVFTPGDLCEYANMYLRLPNVQQEKQVQWNIQKVEMMSYGVADTDKAYSIALNKRTVAPLVCLSRDGILLSIHTEQAETSLPEPPQGKDAPQRVNARDYMNQDILSAGSNAKIAELTAEKIYELRESYDALIKGEADNTPKDGAQLKLMLDQLKQQETALTSLFKGNTDESTEVFVIDVTPTECNEKMILFRFSQQLGVVDNDDLAGEPVYLSLKNLHTIPAEVEDEKAAKKKSKMEQGVYYNVPERVAIKLFTARQELCKGECSMGQFGKVEILSNVLFDKKATTQVTFYQQNGAIKQLTDNAGE